LFNLDPKDYQGWAYGLKKAGYATNPRYAPTLIKLIEEYHLQDYTLIALGKTPAGRDIAVQTPTDTVYKGTGGFVSVNKIFKPEEQKHDGNKEAAFQTDKVITVESKEAVKEKGIVRPVYPDGEFKINETRVIHAKKGTSFLAIAGQYNIPLARIFEFNDMKETEAVAGDQLIYLQRKRKTGNNEFHTVQPGETLHAIAQQEALRIESLLEYNFLKPGDKPAAGEQLHLRTKSAAKPKMALKENFSLISDSKIPSAN
jgi:LysM repeat protein